MNDADKRAVAHLSLNIPLTLEDYRTLGECTDVGQAALLLGADETALVEWYERPAPDPGPIARVLSRAVDRDDVVDRIDATLDEDPTVLEDLARARVTWSHPKIVGLLDRADFLLGSAWHLCQTDPEAMEDWLTAERDVQEVGNAARVIAMAGVVELFDVLSEWVAPASEADGRWGAKIEGALFALSPARWARGYLGGMWEGEFLADWVAMADIMSVAPPSYWTRTLAALRKDADEFALVARLAAAGVSATLTMSPDDTLERIVDAYDNEEWGALSRHPLLSTALVLADDEKLEVPLVETATNDLLGVAGIPSPGIMGLPLSATKPTDEAVADAATLLTEFGNDPEKVIPVVATLCDFAELSASGDDRMIALRDAVGDLAEGPGIIGDVARDALSTPSFDQLASIADGTGIESVVAAEALALRGTVAGREPIELINLWADGPLLRSPLYSGLVHQNIIALPLD